MISVIVPVYKVEAYLRQSLDSILGQTYKDLDIILIVDGSPDRCGDICETYAQKDSRIRVFIRRKKDCLRPGILAFGKQGENI